MKWMKAVLCSVLLGVTGTAVSSDDVKESPTDYATGVMLETFGTSPWYRVSLRRRCIREPHGQIYAMYASLTTQERPCRLCWWHRKPSP